MKIFGREPAVALGIVSAALSLVVTFGIGLSSEQAGAIVAVISAVFAAITAWVTRPVAPSAFTGLVAAVVALLASFHYDVAPETVGSLNALILALLVFITRGQVEPTGRHAAAKHSDTTA
jgi:lipopolysaccharide export LptBFGC system permease protein LptF